MPLHAVRNVTDALDATHEFLTPVDRRRWLKLALVALFVGGGVGVPTPGVNATSSGGVPAATPRPDVPGDAVLVAVALGALAAVLALAFVLVGSVMEFVLVESLRTGDVALRRHWRRRWRQGLHLFGFRVALGVAVAVVALALLAVALGPLLLGFGGPVGLLAPAVAVPLLLLLGVAAALGNGFTTAFVVPVAILEGCGVLAGWRRLWPSVVADWEQYLAYAAVALALRLGVGLAVAVAVGVVALVLLVPLGALGLLVAATLSLSSPAGLAVLAVLALAFGLLLLVAAALVGAPAVTYLRYYALFVLGDVAPALDPVPDRRAAVRA